MTTAKQKLKEPKKQPKMPESPMRGKVPSMPGVKKAKGKVGKK